MKLLIIAYKIAKLQNCQVLFVALIIDNITFITMATVMSFM